MPDIVDSSTRSRMMAGIRGRNTRPELAIRRALFARGFRYRLDVRSLPGRPDIVLPRHRAAIFVHGCFWHRHAGCRFATSPATRPEFWQAKFLGNIERDASARAELLRLGWRVATIWECGTRRTGSDLVGQLADWILGSSGALELPFPQDDHPATATS